MGERQKYKTSELLPGKVNVQLHAVIYLYHIEDIFKMPVM